MATHLFVCGHGEIDPGAGGNGITERDWTRDPLIIAVHKWAAMLKKNKIEIFSTAQNMYYKTQQGWGAYSVSTSYASVTELHLDASSNSNTSGGHVIISSKFSPDSYDKALAKVVKSFCGWHPAFSSDGISRRSDLLNLNVFAKRGISYRLIELGFITSKKDTDVLKKNYDALGKALVEAVTGETISVAKNEYYNQPGLYELLKDDTWYGDVHLKTRSTWKMGKGSHIWIDEVVMDGKIPRGRTMMGKSKRYITLNKKYVKKIS